MQYSPEPALLLPVTFQGLGEATFWLSISAFRHENRKQGQINVLQNHFSLAAFFPSPPWMQLTIPSPGSKMGLPRGRKVSRTLEPDPHSPALPCGSQQHPQFTPPVDGTLETVSCLLPNLSCSPSSTRISCNFQSQPAD